MTRFPSGPSGAVLAAVLLLSTLSIAPSARAASRGELLYATHCIACHTSQAHWRDQKLATNWDTLKAQVQRWQAAAMLQWEEEDVLEVTRYLNGAFYRFAQPLPPLGSLVLRPGTSATQ